MSAPRVSPRWEQPEAVAGFVRSPPNATLLDWADGLAALGARTVLDLGCGAGRNALPLAELGLRVTGVDLSEPMIAAAQARLATWPGASAGRPAPVFKVGPMAPLLFPDATFDVIVAHGIWNLATTDAELRAAVAEAARVARPGAGLFLFTFSRHTLPPAARPVAGERYVYADFAGEPQCFLTADEVVAELGAAGFEKDPPGPLTEHNRPAPGLATGGPVIWEGTFVRRA